MSRFRIRQRLYSMFRMVLIILMLGLYLFAIALSSCTKQNQQKSEKKQDNSIISYSFSAMNTQINLQLGATDDAIDSNLLLEQTKQIIHDATMLYNPYEPESLISKINATAGQEYVEIEEEFYNLLSLAISYTERSNGKFDITYAPLKEIWNFKSNDFTIPSQQVINTYLSKIGYQQLKIRKQDGTYFLKLENPYTRMDLGGIAKGLVIDKTVALFRNHGITDFVVDMGGDLFVQGKHGNRDWTVGVKHPRKTSQLIGVITHVYDKAVATSGDYERFVYYDGTYYHHILDPTTGYPADASVSCTVIAPTAMEADVAATTLFILGPEKGVALANQMPEIDCLIIDQNLDFHFSDQFTQRYTFVYY